MVRESRFPCERSARSYSYEVDETKSRQKLSGSRTWS